MISRYSFSFLFLFFLSGVPSMKGQNEQLHHQIDQIIQYEANIDFALVPGVLVGVIDGDSTFVNSYGQPLSPDSLYELGSVTKPFVAWLVDQALDALGWNSNESICLFLPESICDEAYQLITFTDVLQHRTGLPRLPLDIGDNPNSNNDPYAAYDEFLMANDLMQLEPAAGTYSYSHMGYALWYWLFDKVGGLENFSKVGFYDSLHLKHTKWFVDDAQVAQGHGMDGRPKPVWHTRSLRTAFGLKSSMNDILSFIRLTSPALAARNSMDLRTQKKEINKLSRVGEYKLADGWFLVVSGSSVIYFHTGRTGGTYVSAAFIPEMMKGVVVITNSAIGSNDLALRVLDMVQRRKG